MAPYDSRVQYSGQVSGHYEQLGLNTETQGLNQQNLGYLQMQERLNSLEIEKAIALAQIEAGKRAWLESNKTAEERVRAEQSADIASKRELQSLSIKITKQGDVLALKELFEGQLKEKASFLVKKSELLNCGNRFPLVLYAIFSDKNRKETEFYIELSDGFERKVRGKLLACGVSFGVKGEKATLLMLELIKSLIQSAENVEVPLNHEWYKDRYGEWDYAFSEDRTWEEVKKYVGK